MPIRPRVQKIIGDKLVTDGRQTDRQTDRQKDIFELTPIHKGNFLLLLFFFAYGRERTNGVKFIPPYSLHKFAWLTCSARRGIKKNFSISNFLWVGGGGVKLVSCTVFHSKKTNSDFFNKVLRYNYVPHFDYRYYMFTLGHHWNNY
jgi:hypothetical protein